MKKDQMLEFYAQKFSTVEINSTFYHLINKKTCQKWYETTSDNFIFSVKVSRLITHYQKLKNVSVSLNKFVQTTKYLKEKLGPYLFLLPANFTLNAEKLNNFCKLISNRSAIEFRNPTWFKDDIYLILKNYQIAFCIYEYGSIHAPYIITADFIYVRLHGSKKPYQGKYSKKTLVKWAQLIKKWNKLGKDVYLYFDNDEMGYAPRNALELIEILS